MYLLKDLIKDLENELNKNEIHESIVLRISNVKNFDFQIENLVKYQKNDNIKKLAESFAQIISSDPIINNFEITKNYFINLEIDLKIFFKDFKNIKENIKVNNPKK